MPRTTLRLCSLLLALLASSSRLTGQSAGLAARMHEAVRDNALDTEDLKPWHLRAEIQLLDPAGAVKEEGTAEEWWAAPDQYRLTWTTPSFTGSELRNKDLRYLSRGGLLEPELMNELLEQVLHPIDGDEIDRSTPDLRRTQFAKVELECVMLDQPIKNAASIPLGLFPTYCLDPGKSSLRIAVDTGSITFVRNRMGVFQGHTVALDITAESNRKIVAKSHTSTLETVPPEQVDLSPAANMERAPIHATSISGGVMAATLIHKVPPVYPDEAKRNHVSGIVVLHAIIGRDGRVRSLRVMSAPDASLAIAALTAVRQWVYKPYLLNSEPTEVDTTITLHFNFG